MFGHSYSYMDWALRERHLGGGINARPDTKNSLEYQQLEYARALLADLLNRANNVELAIVAAKEDQEKEADLLLALRVFLDDVEEARQRGRRAGLFREDPINWMDPRGGTEYAKDLAKESADDLLVPEHIAFDRTPQYPDAGPVIETVAQ